MIMHFKSKAIPSASKSENKHNNAIFLINGFLNNIDNIITMRQIPSIATKLPNSVVKGIIKSNNGFFKPLFIK